MVMMTSPLAEAIILSMPFGPTQRVYSPAGPGTTACVPTLDMIYQLKMSVSELVEACPLTVDEIRG
ncbi:hypothetical protein B296_00019634, partial [Ensete ventricosum]